MDRCITGLRRTSSFLISAWSLPLFSLFDKEADYVVPTSWSASVYIKFWGHLPRYIELSIG